jgi:hypothetical protein
MENASSQLEKMDLPGQGQARGKKRDAVLRGKKAPQRQLSKYEIFLNKKEAAQKRWRKIRLLSKTWMWIIQNWYVIRATQIMEHKKEVTVYMTAKFWPSLQIFGDLLRGPMKNVMTSIWFEQTDLGIIMDNDHMQSRWFGQKENHVIQSLQPRCDLITLKVLEVFDAFSDSLDAMMSIFGSLYQAKGILDLLKTLVSHTIWLPDEMFFESEVGRLKYAHSGKIKSNVHTQKMLLISTIIYRVLIGKVMNNPWLVFPGYPIHNFRFEENLKIICSVVYHVFNSFILKSTTLDWNCFENIHKAHRPKFLKKFLLLDMRVAANVNRKEVPMEHRDKTKGCFQVFHLFD